MLTTIFTGTSPSMGESFFWHVSISGKISLGPQWVVFFAVGGCSPSWLLKLKHAKEETPSGRGGFLQSDCVHASCLPSKCRFLEIWGQKCISKCGSLLKMKHKELRFRITFSREHLDMHSLIVCAIWAPNTYIQSHLKCPFLKSTKPPG